MRIDWDDERFIDKSYLDAFRIRSIDVDQPSGDHDGKVVAVCHGRAPSVGDQIAWIDEEIAELIYWIWKTGIQTDESCQDAFGDGATVLVGFPDDEELRAFLKAAVPYDEEPGGLYDRATGCNLDPDAEGSWEYACFPKHARWYDIPSDDYVLPMSVTLPRSDVAALVDNLQQHHETNR